MWFKYLCTWRIQQHHIVSCIQPSSFQKDCCDFLSSFVQLRTSCCAHCHALEEKEETQLNSRQTKWIIIITINKKEKEKAAIFAAVSLSNTLLFDEFIRSTSLKRGWLCGQSTLAFSSTYRMWSGSVCALHCSASDKNWCWWKESVIRKGNSGQRAQDLHIDGWQITYKTFTFHSFNPLLKTNKSLGGNRQICWILSGFIWHKNQGNI